MTTAFIPLDALRGTGVSGGPAATGPALSDLEPVGAPWMHLVPGDRPLVFVVDGSRLYEVSPELFAALSTGDEPSVREFHEAVGNFSAGGDRTTYALLDDPVSLSLNVAQACNLSCSYCYADKGPVRRGGAVDGTRRSRSRRSTACSRARGAGESRSGSSGESRFSIASWFIQCVEHARERGRALGTPSGFRSRRTRRCSSRATWSSCAERVLGLGEPGRSGCPERPAPARPAGKLECAGDRGGAAAARRSRVGEGRGAGDCSAR